MNSDGLSSTLRSKSPGRLGHTRTSKSQLLTFLYNEIICFTVVHTPCPRFSI